MFPTLASAFFTTSATWEAPKVILDPYENDNHFSLPKYLQCSGLHAGFLTYLVLFKLKNKIRC